MWQRRKTHRNRLEPGISAIPLFVCTPGKLAFQSLNLSAYKVVPAIKENDEWGCVCPGTSVDQLLSSFSLYGTLNCFHVHSQGNIGSEGQVSLARVL